MHDMDGQQLRLALSAVMFQNGIVAVIFAASGVAALVFPQLAYGMVMGGITASFYFFYINRQINKKYRRIENETRGQDKDNIR